MSFQLCPLCQGKGGGLVEACPVCLNKLVIDDKTGKPPSFDRSQLVEPVAKPQTVSESKPEDLVKPLSVFDEPTDEEVLYYATPYYDILQENKAEMAKKKKESING
jgi:hypothetical protein